MSYEIGQIVGSYNIIDELHNARTGVSYKVRNANASDRLEILRIMPREMQDDREQVERFKREMKVHQRLAHPNIVAFYSAEQIEGQLVTTTEWVEGETLAQLLERTTTVPLMDGLSYICQALSALAYAHEHGVVHREIAAAHIIVNDNGGAKLTGFGLAKSANDPQLTQAGVVMGWLEYMSPEQVKGIPLDARSDIYAMGIIAYEVATGMVPFVCQSQFDLMLAHVNTAPKPLIETKPDLPVELNNAILKALAKDPKDRFQTAREFHSAIEVLLDDAHRHSEILERAKAFRDPSEAERAAAAAQAAAKIEIPVPAPAAAASAATYASAPKSASIDLPPPARSHIVDTTSEEDAPGLDHRKFSPNEMMAAAVVIAVLIAFFLFLKLQG